MQSIKGPVCKCYDYILRNGIKYMHLCFFIAYTHLHILIIVGSFLLKISHFHVLDSGDPFIRTTMFLPLPRKDKKQYILLPMKEYFVGFFSSSVCKIKVEFLILTYKSNPKPKYFLKTQSSVQETFIGGILERYVCR